MSWANELYQVYELVQKTNDAELLPIYHSMVNAHIEVTLDTNGNFKGAEFVSLEDAATIIPDTGKAKTGKTPPPYPFAESLKYLAGDWNKFAVAILDNSKFYDSYIEQLRDWKNSVYSHPAVNAVFQYISKKELLADLIKSNRLKLDPNSAVPSILPTQLKINAEKIFIRFIVNYNNFSCETRTWCDKTLYNSFISFFSQKQQCEGSEQLCYATGQKAAITEVHPYGIVKAQARAKLISSNDETGFAYRGRFNNKKEALSISYDFSQKMHNALKWLISKQGLRYGSLTLVTWASALENVPNALESFPPHSRKNDTSDVNKDSSNESEKTQSENDWDDEESYDSLPLYKTLLSKFLTGYQQQFRNDTKVMLLGLDAATTGRLSIALYEELQGSEFLKNLESWHENSAWIRYDKNKKQNVVKSFSLFEIINTAYGIEQSNDEIKCDNKIVNDQILRLLPCVINGRPVPRDLIVTLYNRASKPLSYKKTFNHRATVEVACGMIRAHRKGEATMGYDPNEKDRSYLYGCLLAIADKAERDTYDVKDLKSRVTNARRYWANFSRFPYKTWGVIEERLRPYLDQNPYRTTIEKQIQELTEKFTPSEFKNNSALEPLYLLGYHHFTAYMYRNREEKTE